MSIIKLEINEAFQTYAYSSKTGKAKLQYSFKPTPISLKAKNIVTTDWIKEFPKDSRNIIIEFIK